MTIDYRSAPVWTTFSPSSPGTEEMRGASMTLAQEVRRGEEVLVDGRNQVAAVAGGGRAVRIPDELRAALTMPR